VTGGRKAVISARFMVTAVPGRWQHDRYGVDIARAGPGGQVSGLRISCGVIWAVIAAICAAGGVGELTIGNATAAIMCFVFAAGSAFYDFRVWTLRARLLVLIIGVVTERPPAIKPGRRWRR
jgi:hypothetical protein